MSETEQKPLNSEETIKNNDKSLKPWQFQKGNPGGPGRPEGSFSLKTILSHEIQKQPEGQQVSYALALIKKQLRQAIIDGDQSTQRLIWNYIEGMPVQDITSGGEKINPIPIYGGLSNDNSNKKDIQPEEKT